MADQSRWERYQADALLWHEQRIQATQETAKRHWLGLIAALILCTFMLVSMVCLLFKKNVAVIVVHHRSDASVWLSQVNKASLTRLPRVEIEGNIAHYIQARESYSAMSYRYQYSYIKHASTRDIYHAYAKKESHHHGDSKVREDGFQFGRTVLIHDIMFMPDFKASHHDKQQIHQDPMADVAYQLCRYHLSDGVKACLEKHALLAWHFRGVPGDPDERWLNWRGFTVSYFHTSILSHSSSSGQSRANHLSDGGNNGAR